MTPYEQIKEQISTLQSALLDSNPRMPTMLREIHTRLKNDPGNVTLLSEEDIRILVSGLEKQTQTTLVSSMTKTSSAKSKALKNVKSSDLF